jgi:hypothetical protein
LFFNLCSCLVFIILFININKNCLEEACFLCKQEAGEKNKMLPLQAKRKQGEAQEEGPLLPPPVIFCLITFAPLLPLCASRKGSILFFAFARSFLKKKFLFFLTFAPRGPSTRAAEGRTCYAEEGKGIKKQNNKKQRG